MACPPRPPHAHSARLVARLVEMASNARKSSAGSDAHGSGSQSLAGLPAVGEALAVCAHPDDESFGLGGVLELMSRNGTRARVLCFTHGEASTLGDTALDLAVVRARELRDAASVLGVSEVTLHSYADGRLNQVPLAELATLVDDAVGSADLLLVFDEGGITGHPDHRRATEAGLLAASRHGIAVLAWAVPETVANQLNAEHGTTFLGRPDNELDITVTVDREQQKAAIACHASQSNDNPVLWRRLELSGNEERLRWLTRA